MNPSSSKAPDAEATSSAHPVGEALRPLRIHTVRSSDLQRGSFRLDAAFYQSDFLEAQGRVRACGLALTKLRTMASAFVPGRTRLITVRNPEAGAPYLRAHDAFEIRPKRKRFVAKVRTPNYEELLLRRGMILTPSSGRNLGPVAYVGSSLAGFAMTDIMRIVPNSEEEGFYLLAYLLTPTAQALIKRGRSGTTVDHLAPDEVLEIDVPLLAPDVRKEVVDAIKRAEGLLDEGRTGLDRASRALHQGIGLADTPPLGEYLTRDAGEVFSVNLRDLSLRLDAASYDPSALRCKREVMEKGGIPLGKAAKLKTLERYIRFYVEPPHGRPVLSGRQMLQLRPVNLRRISDRSFKDPSRFVLKAGSTIFTCDGRSEEALGEPAYVMKAWDGWMASEHVMRAEPEASIGAGYLYLALTSPWVQTQLKARATGSVIDALEPEEIEDVALPLVAEAKRRELDKEVQRCWDLISESIQLVEQVADRFDQALGGMSGKAKAA